MGHFDVEFWVRVDACSGPDGGVCVWRQAVKKEGLALRRGRYVTCSEARRAAAQHDRRRGQPSWSEFHWELSAEMAGLTASWKAPSRDAAPENRLSWLAKQV